MVQPRINYLPDDAVTLAALGVLRISFLEHLAADPMGARVEEEGGGGGGGTLKDEHGKGEGEH